MWNNKDENLFSSFSPIIGSVHSARGTFEHFCLMLQFILKNMLQTSLLFWMKWLKKYELISNETIFTYFGPTACVSK